MFCHHGCHPSVPAPPAPPTLKRFSTVRYPAIAVHESFRPATERSTRRSRPTIADVARRAGVSPAAVSFAVNDRPGVSPETRERILAAARELGWRPSASARALTEARTRAIGLVLARDPAQLELDSFFVRFLSGIERTLAPADYALLLQLVPAGAGSLAAYERLAARRPRGRLPAHRRRARATRASRCSRPQACRWCSPGARERRAVFPWVETRHAEGMVDGRRAPARRWGTRGSASSAAARATSTSRRGCSAGARPLQAAGAGRPGGARGGDGATRRACSTAAERGRVRERPLALALVAAARARGLAVPDDLSVTGFDDSPLAALAVAGADLRARRLRGVRRRRGGRAAGAHRRRRAAGVCAFKAHPGGASFDRGAWEGRLNAQLINAISTTGMFVGGSG